MNRPRRALLPAVLLAAALSVVGCTEPSEPTPSPGPPRAEPAGLPELAVADEPRWGSAELDLQLDTISFVGADTAVVRGYTEDSDFPQLHVVDARTGTERWSTGMQTPLGVGEDAYFMATEWAVAGAPGAEVVIGRYYAESCITEPCPEDPSPEEGVVGLSLRDGSVEWVHPVLPSLSTDDPALDDQRDLTIQVVSAGNDGLGAPAVVVGPTMAINGAEEASADAFHTLGVDPADGTETWSVDGVVGQRGAGELLLATVPSGKGPAEGGPVALDAADGTERWNVAAEHANTNLLGTGESTLLIVNVVGGTLGSHHVLDLADGSVVHDLGRAFVNPLLDSGTGDLVVGTAEADPYSLVSAVPADDEPLRSARPLESAPTVSLVADGYVFTDRAGTSIVVDRAGTVLGSDLPGTAVLLTEDVLVLRDGTGADSTFGVYDRE